MPEVEALRPASVAVVGVERREPAARSRSSAGRPASSTSGCRSARGHDHRLADGPAALGHDQRRGDVGGQHHADAAVGDDVAVEHEPVAPGPSGRRGHPADRRWTGGSSWPSIADHLVDRQRERVGEQHEHLAGAARVGREATQRHARRRPGGGDAAPVGAGPARRPAHRRDRRAVLDLALARRRRRPRWRRSARWGASSVRTAPAMSVDRVDVVRRARTAPPGRARSRAARAAARPPRRWPRPRRGGPTGRRRTARGRADQPSAGPGTSVYGTTVGCPWSTRQWASTVPYSAKSTSARTSR